ncbi:dirigent protein 1-like [Miscanthus floridulus]|uniref:dirigent protein 1-like n=1 Tax=Miscanthus floridulus TaxID=154761 RepID=UPI003458D8A8
MATSTAPVLLLLLLPLLLSMSAVLTLAADSNGTTHLSFFMHDITSGSNPTAVKVIKGPGSTLTAPTLGMTFGDTTVIDDPLTATSSPTSAELGRMQGIYMLASQSGAALMVCANLLLTSGAHNGSTLAVMGRDDTGEDVREIPVVGGTGTFRMATGYVLWKTPQGINGTDATVQLDVYVTTDGNGVDALAPAPAPGGDGGGDSSSGGSAGSGGSKSSSGAATARRMTGGWVVAVVVAVVGSPWVW